ncbi:uncharacterized protein LOC113849188 [Abrus precatorius]|uniref:Uncharacterized protein LOC113849188 n=1 Tax=Abrus precatorius TaxID=3816 RepID=A0A8B8JT78_ABRPR|nr:uncharacterized protein LOC113849188 [Abrus precatorius]
MGGGTVMHSDHSVPKLRNTLNKFSSPSPPSNIKPPLSTDNNLSCSSCHTQLCTKQELLGGKEATSACRCLYNHVFEPVPSQSEVEDAVYALQEFIQAVSSSSTLQQILGSCDPRVVMSQGYKRLNDALQLLQADPAIKRLVVSLSSDKALWDAVMSNVLHQKQLLELPDSVECRRPPISEQNEFGIICSWILDIIKGKILELIESFQSLVNDLFQSPGMKNATTDATELDEKVRSSFLLSILILLIVIMARSQKF